MTSGLDAGFLLDRQWHWLRNEMEQTKRPALLALGRILANENLMYAIIGGIALQVHQREPRTTLDIDIALLAREAIPRVALTEAGFAFHAAFEHSENWYGSDGTPVQFSDDPALASAVINAEELQLDQVTLRIIRVVDLLHEKIRAGSDPARRRSKRLQDLADVEGLIEGDPALAEHLTPGERALLERLP